MFRFACLLLAASAWLLTASCGGFGGDDDDSASTDLDQCSCSWKELFGTCEQLDRLPGDTREMAPFCFATENGCSPTGGVYSEGPCARQDRVGACFDDNTTSDDADKPFSKTSVYYSTGDPGFDAASAEEDCEEDEVFQP